MLLKSIGALGSASVLGAVGPIVAGSHPVPEEKFQSSLERATSKADLVRLESPKIVVWFDQRNGTIYSITHPDDAMQTNYLGNSDNTRGVQVADTHWTGDLVTTIGELKTAEWIRDQASQSFAPFRISGKWKGETTLESPDIRAVSIDSGVLTVKYPRKSKNENGIQSYRLTMTYRLAADSSLLWDIEIENATDRTLELGELAFPIRANDDYASAYQEPLANGADPVARKAAAQRTTHEQMVLAHAFVAGHSSYVLMQRPRGDAPFLLLHCAQNTSFECIYKTEGALDDSWIGTDLLAVHSNAAKDQRNWEWNPWVNGHTSLVLEPGQKKAYQLRLVFINDYSEIQNELARSGNLGIRILPSMVVSENSDVHVELSATSDLEALELHSDGITVRDRSRTANSTLLTLSFQSRGQKTLKLLYNGNRWTKLHFFCVEDPEQLLKARGKFMAERQFYENPADPYHRNHMFLPYDYRRNTRFDENDDVWEVGGTDDPGFGEPIFLAEKNVYFPSRLEIERLEMFVSDCLFRYIQNPETYEVRASLYYQERVPSSRWGSWSKKRSEVTWRSYNYAFVANIYHSMYRIGKRYDALTRHTALDYLRMCYQTSVKWFTTGPYRHWGLITGSNAVEILEDLREEGWSTEYQKLRSLMAECNESFLRDPYPYSSEIEIDETGQHQVYFFTRYFGTHGSGESEQKNRETLRVLKALRGGDQPIWFSYGNDLFAHPYLRGQISCWHSEALNGMCLLKGFEDTGDAGMLVKGYAGLMSVMHNVLADGMGFGWFKLDPGTYACEPPRTFEGGPGLYGFLRGAKSYAVHDDIFGLVGFGCRAEASPSGIKVFPKDGVRKRVMLVPEKLDFEATRGEIKSIAFDSNPYALHIEMEDTTGMARTVELRIQGLSRGEYKLTTPGAESAVQSTGLLKFTVPVEQASSIRLEKH